MPRGNYNESFSVIIGKHIIGNDDINLIIALLHNLKRKIMIGDNPKSTFDDYYNESMDIIQEYLYEYYREWIVENYEPLPEVVLGIHMLLKNYIYFDIKLMIEYYQELKSLIDYLILRINIEFKPKYKKVFINETLKTTNDYTDIKDTIDVYGIYNLDTITTDINYFDYIKDKGNPKYKQYENILIELNFSDKYMKQREKINKQCFILGE